MRARMLKIFQWLVHPGEEYDFDEIDRSGRFHYSGVPPGEFRIRAVTEEGVREFLARFIPEPPADIVTDRVRQNIADARQQIRNLLDGPTIPPAHRRTAYGLFEAGIEYLDHLRSYRSAESYFNRCVFRPERLKRRLVELVQSVAA